MYFCYSIYCYDHYHLAFQFYFANMAKCLIIQKSRHPTKTNTACLSNRFHSVATPTLQINPAVNKINNTIYRSKPCTLLAAH